MRLQKPTKNNLMDRRSVNMSQSGSSTEICTHCKQPFLSPEARVCGNRNCGKPRPIARNKPEGPPCAYCSAPLLKHGAKVCLSCGRRQPPPSSEKPKGGQADGKNISSLTPTRTKYPPNSELVVNPLPKTPGAQGAQHSSAHALQQQQQPLNNNEQFLITHISDQYSGGNFTYSGQEQSTRSAPGIEATGRTAMRMIFHAIAPLEYWEWNYQNSSMHIRFSNEKLGNWRVDLGEFHIMKDLGDGWCEMMCTFERFDGSLLAHNASIAYKYVIHSPKSASDSNPYEFLHDHGHVNRCLIFPNNEVEKGECHKYDTIVYPRGTSISRSFYANVREKGLITAVSQKFGSVVESAGSAISSLFKSKKSYTMKEEEDRANFVPLDNASACKYCLQVYLEPLKMRLCSGKIQKGDCIYTMASRAAHIFHSMSQYWIWRDQAELGPKLDLKSVFKEWLESLLESLKMNPLEEPEKELTIAAFIMCCIGLRCQSYDSLKKKEFLAKLGNMLALQPSLELKRCPNYEFLLTCLHNQRRNVQNFITWQLEELSQHIHEIKFEGLPSPWLDIVPLYHFLKKQSRPFTGLGDPAKISWNVDDKLGLANVKKGINDKKFVDQILEIYQAYCTLDPLFTCTLIQLAPRDCFKTLCSRVSPSLTTAWLAGKGPINEAEVVDITECVQCIQSSLLSKWHERSHGHPEMWSILNLSVKLLKNILVTKRSPSRYILLLAASILYSLYIMMILDQQSGGDVSEYLNRLRRMIQEWLVDFNVIGPFAFGGSHENNWKGKMELEIWNTLLSKTDLPHCQILTKWQELVGQIVRERLLSLNQQLLRIKVLKLMPGDMHPLLADIITEIISSGFVSEDGQVDKLPETKEVGLFFGKVLMKTYPHPEDISGYELDCLLKWGLWPTLLSACVKKSAIWEGIDKKYQRLCILAVNELKDVCDKLQSGEVVVRVIHSISVQRYRMDNLCKSIATKDEFQALSKAIDARLEELNIFNEQRRLLKHLCLWVQNECTGSHTKLKIKDAEVFIAQLNGDFHDLNINTLCKRNDEGKVVVICFQSGGSLLKFADNFYSISLSALFKILWRSAILTQTVSSAQEIMLDDLYCSVWQPCLENCHQLIQSLMDMDIKLFKVDEYLKLYGVDFDKHVEVLFREVNKTIPISGSLESLNAALRKVHHYERLCRYHEGATIILKLKDSLGLVKGDFREVEMLSQEFSTSMKDQTLKDVDDSLVQVGEFLQELITQQRIECLQQFIGCKKIVEWLREETNDANEIQKFVTVALTTAAGGENDYAHDRLSNLRIVGSGYSPLIYSLPQNASFTDFKRACVSVWNSLDSNPRLPELLKQCNKSISWYQGVKGTQGSVEVTSYGQMRSILRYGYCNIGASAKSAQSIGDLISLELHPPNDLEKPPCKLKYNLDELHDLQSKLVLITGSKADNRMEVDHFLDILQYVTRIADILLDLQQSGNVKYIGWTMKIRCAMYTVITDSDTKQEPQLEIALAKQLVDSLKNIAKQMECGLEDWRNKVEGSRKDHYELNYYTTLQLLGLRKELALVRSIAGKQCSPEILALLQSISLNLTFEDVHDAIMSLQESSSEERRSKHSVQEELSDGAKELDQFSIPTSLAMDQSLQDSPAAIPPSSESHNSTPSDIADEHILAGPAVLKEEDLEAQQRDIFTDLVGYQSYSKELVLKALESSSSEANLYDIQQWCDENQKKFHSTSSKSPSSAKRGAMEKMSTKVIVSDTESEDLSDDESNSMDIFSLDSRTQPQAASTPVHPTTIKHVATPTVVSPEMKIVYKDAINKSHPLVQELVDDHGYDLEASIEAVRLNPNDLQGAMDHLAHSKSARSNASSSTIVRSSANGLQTGSDQNKPGMDKNVNINISQDGNAEGSHLSLEELGTVLGKLSQKLLAPIGEQRIFKEEFVVGAPNLIVTSPDEVLRAVLALYMPGPLPTLEEVLICESTTTVEEINILWQKAIEDPSFRRIFCLAHAEKLSYQVSNEVIESLKDLSRGQKEYRLVVICGSESLREESRIISKLSMYKRSMNLQHCDDKSCQSYLKDHFLKYPTTSSTCTASSVDFERSSVRVVCSMRSGMGKSLYVSRMAEKLDQEGEESNHVTIPIHGPQVTSDLVLKSLQKYYGRAEGKIYHFDIAPNVFSDVDTILFSLLILRGLSDSQGHVWRCHPSQFYAVEVTLPEAADQEQPILETQTSKFLYNLPKVTCLSPRDVLQSVSTSSNPSSIGMDQGKFHSCAFQRVYQYLWQRQAKKDLDQFVYEEENLKHDCAECLQLLIENCGVSDPSWSEINHFITFFDLQLKSCENSDFFIPAVFKEDMPGLKEFVVKFMIQMSRDFSTPSLRGEVLREEVQVEGLKQYHIEQRRYWEKSTHSYIFFNEDRTTVTFVGFIIDKRGNLCNPQGVIIKSNYMSRRLHDGLERQEVKLSDNHNNWQKEDMIKTLATVIGIKNYRDPDKTYVLTVDNLIKILAIQMRFRCGIPVVIMGETGCGKTRLIRYMCDLARGRNCGRNMLILKVHGGTKEEDIFKFMATAEREAKRNREKGMDTVVFFDEANTTDAIGLIKEIICDRRMYGEPVSEDLKFIAACNPYRKHSEEMIKKLENAGLGFYVRATDTTSRLGKIPLRQLVYRVLDLPLSMRPLVYDFGQLQQDTEDKYIKKIVSNHISNHGILSNCISPIANVLAKSQAYMRKCEDECSFVSLRDVERAMIVFKYFYGKKDLFNPLIREKQEQELRRVLTQSLQEDAEDQPVAQKQINDITRALVLSLSVCYHARLQKRDDYEEMIAQEFTGILWLPRGSAQFRDEIRWCQEVLLDNMILGKTIAKNAALRENVFMMAICIELRIPLFLVGKPGSSKSLAKSIIQDSMQGMTSDNDLMRNFKQVHMFSYQCSQLSTPESVIEVFDTASSLQNKQGIEQGGIISVVVLDEVGLAEDSPNLPLKALHPLLEDGTEGAGAEGEDKIIEQEKRVAFIGISNWALDPAKMNRGVMVTRGAPDIGELEFSAQGICGVEENDQTRKSLEKYFKPLAAAYAEICDKQEKEKEFFGLRDFYSLIKMLYWLCEKSEGRELTWSQMKHAILRNFGGFISAYVDPFEVFRRKLESIMVQENPNLENYPPELWTVINPSCSTIGLIKTSLDTKEISSHGENRYLLFLTENYAALGILEHYIRGKSNTSQLPESEQTTKEDTVALKPFTIFGSSFPKDKEYTQICRNINQIKICMETGRTVILLNLDNLYESLYDVLNQYYLHYGDSRYVDLGLQSHRVKCRVHNDFKLIIIAERETVHKDFPIPLINRLEKHFVLTSSVLNDWQKEVLKQFENWITLFSTISEDSECKIFDRKQAFVGYQDDTPAAVVFQASEQLEKLCSTPWKVWHSQLGGAIQSEELTVEQKGSTLWKNAVLRLSQYLLLQIASDDALIRLKRTALADQWKELTQIYYLQQHHSSITDFLKHHIQECGDLGSQDGLLMQVTTHSHLLHQAELLQIERSIDMNVKHHLLQEFDTELDFCNTVSQIFQRELTESEIDRKCLLIIQCDSGHKNADLIACARYRIYDELVKPLEKKKTRQCITHTLFVIYLPPQVTDSTFVGFQGDPWISSHIDELIPTSIAPQDAVMTSISEVFIGDYLRSLLGEVIEEDENRSFEEGSSTSSEDQVRDKTQGEKSDIELEDREFELASSSDSYEPTSVQAIEVFQEQSSPIQSDIIPIPQNPEIQVNTEELLVMDSHSEHETTSDKSEDGSLMEHLNLSDSSPVVEQKHLLTSKSAEKVPGVLEIGAKILPHQHSIAQYKRLYGSIQSAVSKAEDTNNDRSTVRVKRLIKLIPKDPEQCDIRLFSFYGILIKHIYRLLQEREADRLDDSEWVLREALSTNKLQLGGTFRNALIRKIDDVIDPIFAKVIAVIDQYSNLDLIDPKAEESPLSQFWLSMFSEPTLLRLKYSEMQGTIAGVSKKGRKLYTDFKCRMPFFWIIKDIVDCQCDIAMRNAEEVTRVNVEDLRDHICGTSVGGVLDSVDTEKCEEFFDFYLHDFVRSIHMCTQREPTNTDMEYQLIADDLKRIVNLPEFYSSTMTLTSKIAALHLAYEMSKPQILWFGQLVSHSPSILWKIQDNISQREFPEMELHLYAAEKVIEKLEPPLQKGINPNQNLAQWLDHVRLSQNAIDSIINLRSQSDLSITLRFKWQRLQACKLYVEFVMLKHPELNEPLKMYGRRLCARLRGHSNFHEARTLDGVILQVNNMTAELEEKDTVELEQLKEVKKSCREFFMELVASLCFGGNEAPESKLIKLLLDSVYNVEKEEPSTQDLTPYKEFKADKVPTIRSFLLQLLLEHSMEQVRGHLKVYFDKSQRVLAGQEASIDQNLCLLIIQCFEDSLSKRCISQSLPEQAQQATSLLVEGHTALQAPRHGDITLEYLEGMAKVRHSLSIVTEVLKNEESGKFFMEILTPGESCSTESDFDSSDQNDSDVLIFKLTERKYGMSYDKLMFPINKNAIPNELKDSLAEKFSCICLPPEAHDATSTLLKELQNHSQEVSTDDHVYVDRDVNIRLSLLALTEILQNEQNGYHYMKLLRAAGNLCSDHQINCIDPFGRRDTVGPAIYLIKLLVRRYGMPWLKGTVKIHDWILPVELELDDDKSVDPFILYGDLYRSIRGSMNDAIYGNQMDELYEITKDLQPCDVVYILLALYRKATLSRASENPAKRINEDALERLNNFVQKHQLLSDELRFTARALLANHQGGRILEQMAVSPQQPLQCRTILGVVIHAVAVFFSRQRVDILLPFINILKQPSALNQSYLPTMHEDSLVETQDALKVEDPNGKFYECPRGHKYFIGNCGGAYYTGVCNVCRLPIGGEGSVPLTGNRQFTNVQDTTRKGHDLGPPQDRLSSTPERNLSARAVNILRALMHSALVWASCNNQEELEAIAGLVVPPVPPQQLPEFFWAHLEKDFELLGRDTGRGLDETVMIVHLVLRQILLTNPPTALSTLKSKDARKEWETNFNQVYVQPVLSKLNQNVTKAMEIVGSDEQQPQDQLFYLVHEKVKCKDETIGSHLWTYRSRVTIEHLQQTMQEKKMKTKYPILHEFLQAEMDLRATQYLPDIVKLQQCLYSTFNRLKDKMDAKNQTIGEFIQELPDDGTVQIEYSQMICSLREAWNLVRQKLKTHGRLPVEEKYCSTIINDDTPMEYLIPTTSDAGACTTALVDFLALKHNNFVERCRALMAENSQSTLSFWHQHKVPITHLHCCHLLDYEHQLPSIILSHCHYSLKFGKGQDVKYDHQALERHILNRFIHGKPMIVVDDIPHVVYRKDIYTTSTFAEVRKKVAPQEKLPAKIRHDIITDEDLSTPDRLREALDVVEIVLGFLSSGGGKADKVLGDYIDRTLKMKRRHFSQKIKNSCQLKHTLSLWETIAVELARKILQGKQEPFHTIRKEFQCELSEGEVEALNGCLGQFDPNFLLGTLYEFIETYIKHCPLQEHDQPLIEILELVLYEYGTELPQLTEFEFPASIKLNQAVAAWKHIMHYYDKQDVDQQNIY